MELKDKSNMTVAESGKLGAFHAKIFCAFKEDFTPRRGIQAAKKVKQRTLSGARRTDDRNQPAAFDRQIQVLENSDLRRRRLVDLGEFTGFDHGGWPELARSLIPQASTG